MGTARIFPTSLAATSHREFYFSLEGQVTQKIHIYGGICWPRRDSPNGGFRGAMGPALQQLNEMLISSQPFRPRWGPASST